MGHAPALCERMRAAPPVVPAAARPAWRQAARPGAQAYMYGMGRNKRVVLFDTLIEQCSEAQVVAVLAHELGAPHARMAHPMQPPPGAGLHTGPLGAAT